ncbi:hypothetical protein [Mesorhizobium australicum]|uniref:Uncharacterized protein n=1 Tax=Mesorhizobium australicum TaxID=536018 RepID=A0A1X7NMR1_9HYPH|nr:hypothetical protein [Mesorhizobium australicum]SMH38812.1 hypothetical protein SAMN02982922_2099 [Mesorhizobium australicum]
MRIARLAAFALAATIPAAVAQEAETRYTLEKTPDGYVRMDNRTGEMSVCTERAGQLVCRLAADERSAWQGEIDRLTRRLDEVEKRLGALEGSPTPQTALPSEEQFEQSLTFMERFFRRFIDIVKDLEAETDTAKPEAPSPQKT